LCPWRTRFDTIELKLTPMSKPILPVTTATAPCKCCGQTATLMGVVDFSKNCEIARGLQVLPLSGIPVYYHRCRSCGFIFTTAFDGFTKSDFADVIYNAEYAKVDPDFAEIRPRANAGMLAEMFGGTPSLRVLDYGGGNGRTAEELRAHGLQNVTTYDPFVPAHSARPDGKFDLVISFEVMEHAPDPRRTMRELDSFLQPGGLILFSTLLQPADIDIVGLDWWYAAPRNGHVSLHSRRSVSKLVEPYGYTFGSFHDGLHALFRRVPSFASHLIRAAA
jgi:SAM-dependent methyltransferase